MVTKNPDDQFVMLQVDNYCNPVTTLDSILTFVTEACPQICSPLMTIILLVILLCDQKFKQSLVPILHLPLTERSVDGWVQVSRLQTSAHKVSV